MHIRTNKSRKEETTESGELPEVNFKFAGKNNNANQIVSRLQLDEAIAKLADGYRKLLILHDIEGYEHRGNRANARLRFRDFKIAAS